MRKSLLLLLLSVVSGMRGEDILQVTPANLKASGVTQSLYIEMNNAGYTVRALQFDLYLPDGITLFGSPAIYPDVASEGRTTAPTNGTRNYYESSGKYYKAQTLGVQKQDDEAIRVVTHSVANNPYQGTGGRIIRVPVKVSTSLAAGFYPVYMKSVEIAEDGSTFRHIGDCTSYVSVGSPSSGQLIMKGEVPSFTVAALTGVENLTSLNLENADRLNAPLSLANPNAVVYAPSSLGLEGNVVVDGTCPLLTLTDGHPFAPESSFRATRATYSREADADQYGTMVLPFTVTGTFYVLKDAGPDYIQFQATPTLAAGNPALCLGPLSLSADNVTVAPDVTNSQTINGLTMTGAYVAQDIAEGYYIDGYDFQAVTDGYAMEPFRAYFTAQSATGRRAIRIGDTTVGLDRLGMPSADSSPAIHDLTGRRLVRPMRGVNIIGGRKLVVR